MLSQGASKNRLTSAQRLSDLEIVTLELRFKLIVEGHSDLVESVMADELLSTVRSMGTKVEESAGRIADNTKAAAESVKNQAAETVQDAYEKTVEAAKDGVEAAKEAAIVSHDFLRKFMEDNPHTTTAIALGIGVLIGFTATRRT